MSSNMEKILFDIGISMNLIICVITSFVYNKVLHIYIYILTKLLEDYFIELPSSQCTCEWREWFVSPWIRRMVRHSHGAYTPNVIGETRESDLHLKSMVERD